TVALVVALAIVLGLTGAPASHEPIAPATFALALSSVWYAYLGWQDVVLLAEELHRPRRDLPVVLCGTVLVTMVLFIALHVAVYWGLGGGSEAYAAFPALRIAHYTLGNFGENLLNALMVSSLIGVTSAGLLVRPRIAMALARDGLGPPPLTRVSNLGAPYVAM